MNTRTKKPSTLCAALGRAGLARTGAMLALALGAAQAGATTYTVPLQFNLTLTPPVCSLTVLSLTADASGATPTIVPGNVVDLTGTTPPLATSDPTAIVLGLPGTSNITANGAGVYNAPGATARRMLPIQTWVKCTSGTPMSATVTKASLLNNAAVGANYMAGAPASSQTLESLPIGMLMGITSFAGQPGNTTTTWGGATAKGTAPSAIADGELQALNLAAAVYASTNAPLSGSYAGNWSYSFSVNLDF